MTEDPVIHDFSSKPEAPSSARVDLSTQVIRVRHLAQQKLAMFAKADPSGCKEAYLMKSEHFCGLRFTLGSFRAIWLVETTVVEFFRGDNSLGQVEIDSNAGKKAA